MEDRKREREERKRKRIQRMRLQWTAVILAVVLIVVGILAVTRDQGPVTNPDGSVEQGKLTAALVGEKVITLEFGTEYHDAGVQVSYDGATVQANVQTVLPDLSKLGSHKVCYTVTYDGLLLTLERTVTVVDTQAPVLTLLYIPGHCTEVGEVYQDEGCTAVDNYDGDISSKVTAVSDGKIVTYTVSDSSGNTASIQRTIVYGDSVAPEITLLGGDTVTISAGREFEEPGFSATDNIDGDLTASVTVAGQYDKYVPGTYPLTYTVTDRHGNTTTVVRSLVVEGLTQPDIVDPEGKVIYLTFDDGPSEYTPILLEILAKYNVKATFFVVGTAELQYLDDIVAGGHAIGIHSDTHRYNKIYVSEDAFFQDFYAIHEKVLQYTGVNTTLCRFPGGSSNGVSKDYCKGIMTRLTKAVEAQGFQYFDWNVDSDDAGGTKTAQGVYENVISGIRSSRANIVLQHDIYGYSVEAVEKIIQWGLANGYTFLPLDPTSPNAHHPVNN